MNSEREAFDPIAGFEPLLQAPARLKVMAIVANAQEAEFARLKEMTGASDSVMSKHLAALSEAGMVKVSKATSGGRQRTWVAITRAGRRRFDEHVAALHRILAED